MKLNKIHLASLAALVAGNVCAGTMGPTAPAWSPVVTVSVGPAWVDNTKTRDVIYSPNIIKAFTANNTNNTIFSGEVFLGIEKALGYNLLGELGLAVAGNSNIKTSGSVWDQASSAFDNFSYSYTLSHVRVGVKGKLIGDFGQWAQPYFSASIDAGFNRSNKFSLTPKIPEAIPFAPFGSNSVTNVAYTVGVGAQKAFMANWRAGIGYEFASLGQGRLGRASGQYIGSGLSNNLYTNELQFSLSYVA